MDILKLIGRTETLFHKDINDVELQLSEIVSSNKFLVIGAAGSIGQAVCKEIFKRNPKVLHAIDISENNLVELVRELRSTVGYINGDFRTFALDCGTDIFESFFNKQGRYDYILNLSALKHVRSEKDPFTLMRMIDVNIFNSVKIAQLASATGAKKYFCVSTDKAANPVNMMGASKRIMELFLARESHNVQVSMARFANVAFSDGSLLHGFNQRFAKQQPISAPNDVRRYFVTPQESGELCLLSCIFGQNLDIFFPKLSEHLHLIDFASIATNYVKQLGFDVHECSSELEARENAISLISHKKWPCYFFRSDTTGEKDFEEFYTSNENLDLNKYASVGIVKTNPEFSEVKLLEFAERIAQLKKDCSYDKIKILDAFYLILEDFAHLETGKYLDSRM